LEGREWERKADEGEGMEEGRERKGRRIVKAGASVIKLKYKQKLSKMISLT
jgi:hypothetical protein